MLATAWWQGPALSAGAALVGVLLAQGVVLWIYRRNERRRGDPELLRWCAQFIAAVDRLKRTLAVDGGLADPAVLDDLESAHASLEVLAPADLLLMADRLVGDIASVLFEDAEGEQDSPRREAFMKNVFRGSAQFTTAVRQHFGRPPRQHVAVPMIPRSRVAPDR